MLPSHRPKTKPARVETCGRTREQSFRASSAPFGPRRAPTALSMQVLQRFLLFYLFSALLSRLAPFLLPLPVSPSSLRYIPYVENKFRFWFRCLRLLSEARRSLFTLLSAVVRRCNFENVSPRNYSCGYCRWRGRKPLFPVVTLSVWMILSILSFGFHLPRSLHIYF